MLRGDRTYWEACRGSSYKKHRCISKQSSDLRWLRAIGDDITTRQQALLTIANLGDENQHWVGLVVDAEEKAIYYGDSLESPIPPDLVETYQWWISQHSSTSFEVKNLPITHQEDGSSCGILADNSLTHFALPNLVPLFKSFEARAARMSAFIHVANHILERVSTHIILFPTSSFTNTY